MSVRIPIRRLALIATAVTGTLAPACSAEAATLKTSRHCYLVGQTVTLSGRGFAASSPYIVSVDDVFFGEDTTSTSGSFSSPLVPGGLGAEVAQSIDGLSASDGGSVANATITVTRPTGARFLASKGNPKTLRAPFEAWDFSPNGAPRSVYLHYVSPINTVIRTTPLGRTSGQCGYLHTASRAVFPFVPAAGSWVFQFDTDRGYSRHPAGPVARVQVGVR